MHNIKMRALFNLLVEILFLVHLGYNLTQYSLISLEKVNHIEHLTSYK